MMQGNGQATVPPGFRFHPTDEELLYYYLRKKVSYEPIDLDVIRDVDLNKLEPWDLKDKCRIGSGPQNEWYFFSRKDKKYPTGTRTNRATAVGFWKATGRDKAIHHTGHPKRIGMRKTLVFYIGRAPNGQKTDWIMHEYRLDVEHEHTSSSDMIQDEGWVVCRVFKKKTLQRGFHAPPPEEEGDQHHIIQTHLKSQSDPNHGGSTAVPWGSLPFCLDTSMHLPQLLSAEATAAAASFMPPMAAPDDPMGTRPVLHERFGGDWPLLDKLLASHQNLSQLFQMEREGQHQSQEAGVLGGALAQGRLPYIGCEADQLLRFSR